MKYFLPDSQDLVDPSFDFETERRSATRLRQRDDLYAHEVFAERAFDGLLVSKGIVDGVGGASGRYTLAQRHRLMRVGAEEFFRVKEARWEPRPIMGDCGAFTYVREKIPPYSAAEVVDFYVACGFDLGISVDHVILDYQPVWDEGGVGSGAPEEVRARQSLTFELAAEFLKLAKKTRLKPLGVAQGWSPKSYAYALDQLQKQGYDYIAVGGMVPLKTSDISASLAAMDVVRKPKTKLHLLGVTRIDTMDVFKGHGVESFDSTSPLLRAFKDSRKNYYTPDREYTAIRIPQVEGNPGLQKAISSGKVPQERARALEKAALAAVGGFARRECSLESTLDALEAYEGVYAPDAGYRGAYAETLDSRAWEMCKCEVCRELGHHVVIFRGAERNRRRGFHNTWVFYRRLRRELGTRPARKAQPATCESPNA